MAETRLRQIVYSSRAAGPVDASSILQASRHNNALDGITGVLWLDGDEIVQVLEGPGESVNAAFQRISRDARHTAITVLSTRDIAERDFGYWSMELGDRLKLEPDQHARLTQRLQNLPYALRRFFE